MKISETFKTVMGLLSLAGLLFMCIATEYDIIKPITPKSTPQQVEAQSVSCITLCTPIPTNTPQQSPTPTYNATNPPTPTQLVPVGTGTPTPTIIEITPMPTVPFYDGKFTALHGIFVPNVRLKVRSCAQTIPDCDTGKRKNSGERVEFYGMVQFFSTGDVWLCLDWAEDVNGKLTSPCNLMIAYQYGGDLFGNIIDLLPSGIVANR